MAIITKDFKNQYEENFADKHKRSISYLRISVTDRCNFTCMYCRDSNDYIHHDQILRFEEIERCISIFAKRGIKKIRFTGGEPFVRKGFSDFFLRVHKMHPELELCVTTNGTFDSANIKLIKEANMRVNLSLDSFDAQNFRKITGKDEFQTVIKNAHALIDADIQVKINAVAMKKVNEHELTSFIEFAKHNPVDVRFIEFMPMGENTLWEQATFWSAKDIINEASKYAKLIPLEHSSNISHAGPAKMYAIEGGIGKFGVITPLSAHFCSTCNRLRITSDGKLRTCLFDDNEVSLKDLLRNKETTDSQLANFIQEVTINKQIGSEIMERRKKEIARTKMVSIGG